MIDDEDWQQKYMEFAIEQSIVSEDALVQRVRDRLPGFEQSIFSKLKVCPDSMSLSTGFMNLHCGTLKFDLPRFRVSLYL